MGKAIALALVQDNALAYVAKSIMNFLKLITNFMYGTPERSKYTFAFVIGLTVLSCALTLTNPDAFLSCSQDTLIGTL